MFPIMQWSKALSQYYMIHQSGDVSFAADSKDGGIIKYTRKECKSLRGLATEEIVAVHNTKEVFIGSEVIKFIEKTSKQHKNLDDIAEGKKE